MPRHTARRRLAMLALALALFAALPCAALAGSDSCCSALARCGDASASPCAQLAATPRCEAPQTPVDASPAPQLPGAPLALLDAEVVDSLPHPPALAASKRPPPAALTGHVTIRDVLLRL